MKVKGPRPLDTVDAERMPAPLRLFLELCQLKQLYRQGWLRRGVPAARCESVAEHAYSVATLALLLTPAELDRDRVVRMALLHDLGEIHAGDLTPAHGVEPREKRARERASVVDVVGRLPDAAQWIALWDEYAAGRSAEARFVRQLDRFEMAMQALVYEHQEAADLDEFFATTEHELQSPELVEAFAAALQSRRARND